MRVNPDSFFDSCRMMKALNIRSRLFPSFAGGETPAISGIPSVLLRRLRSTHLSTLLFYLFGIAIIAIDLVPNALMVYGWKLWLLGDVIPMALFGLMMAVVQQASVESASDMTSRPMRFLLVTAFSAVISYGAVWLYDAVTGMGIFCWSLAHDYLPPYYRYAFFFAPISWLSCLYIQRNENEARLVTLSIRRSALLREVSQSQLLAARSRIDPALVERVLSETRGLYQTDPGSASRLMDQLIDYLRLAMNRARETHPRFSTEITLVRSYVALREREIGVKVDLKVNHPSSPASPAGMVPIFLPAQKMFEALVSNGFKQFGMNIDALERCVLFTLIVAGSLSNEALAELRKNLTDMPVHAADILHRISATGEHSYVIEIRAEHDAADSADR